MCLGTTYLLDQLQTWDLEPRAAGGLNVCVENDGWNFCCKLGVLSRLCSVGVGQACLKAVPCDHVQHWNEPFGIRWEMNRCCHPLVSPTKALGALRA